MPRSLTTFYTSMSSLAGLVACMLYPAFWQPLVVVVFATAVTYQWLPTVLKTRYLLWLGGLGASSALVAYAFGKGGTSLSGIGSAVGLVLGFTAIYIAWRLYKTPAGDTSSL